MTAPRILTARDCALRAQRESESIPSTELHTRVPRRAAEIGALPSRLSTFHPPRPNLEGLERASGHPSRPAGRVTRESNSPRPGLSAPEGVRLFAAPASPADAAARRRLGRDLLRMRPDAHPRREPTPAPTEPSTPEAPRPNLTDCRRDLSEFRSAMAEFTRAGFFGGEGRHVEATAALERAEAAYQRLYSNLPLTPAMSGILDNFQARMTDAQARLAAMTPPRPSRRHA